MRNRDDVGYTQGKQQELKLQVITLLGYTTNKFPHNITDSDLRTQPLIHTLRGHDKLTLWYEMYGRNTKLQLPMWNADKIGKQWDTLPLDSLNIGDTYAVWCYNANEKTHNGKKAGEWYWLYAIKLNGIQAKQVVNFKMSFADKDKAHEIEVIENIVLYGSPHKTKKQKQVEELLTF